MGESPEWRAGQDRDQVRMAAIEGDGCEERGRNVVGLVVDGGGMRVMVRSRWRYCSGAAS